MKRNRILILLAMACIASDAFDQSVRRFGDVQNIGKRIITGTDSGPLTLDKELDYGNRFAAEFERPARLVNDSLTTDLISRIAQNLALHSDLRMPCHFKILDNDDMDVLAFLGGHIYVTRGLITTAENEAELAGAISHGIAHIAARHTARLIEAEMALHVGPGAIPGIHDWHWSSITNFRMGPNFDSETIVAEREFEEEADQLAVQYLWNSGYDPNAYVTFLQKLLEREKKLQNTGHRFLSFMPATKDRITASAQERDQLPRKENYVFTTSEFNRVKTNLLRAQKSEDIIDTPVQKRPAITRKPE